MSLSRFALFYLPIVMLLAGCFGGNPAAVPNDHYYRLPQNKPTAALPQPLIHSTLAIRKLSSHGLYHDRSLLFINTKSPLEIQRYHYHHWTESPPQLIQENLVHYFRNKKIADKVIRFHPGLPADAYIRGRINQFERVLDGNKLFVKVNLELELQSKQQIPLFHGEYEQTIPISGRDMHATVRGFGEALQLIYDAFVDDLRKHSEIS